LWRNTKRFWNSNRRKWSHVVWWSKQRIAIARALYKNPEVLLWTRLLPLDTSAESIVKKVIDDFKLKGKTIIVIAHRLSTIANADTILVMKTAR
jgi:ATP-binding cassette subfamily B protein